MIANLTEYFWAPEFVQKYLNMILHHIWKSEQIGSGQKKVISELAKMLFETYVPAASTLTLSKMADFELILKKNHRVNPIQNGWFLLIFEENHRVDPIQNGLFLSKFEEKS